MALRQIRELDEDILRKTSKDIKDMTPRLMELLADMWDTLHDAQGVGLAAVQVGVLKKMFIVEISDDEKYTFINPKITLTEGEQTDNEGCLSVPGKIGEVTRPEHVVVEALDENMNPFTLDAHELLARAICHEYDHLDGKLYVDIVNGELSDAEEASEEE